MHVCQMQMQMRMQFFTVSRTIPLISLFHSKSKLIPEPHFLIVDTNVVLHQLDVLEDESIVNVVILQVQLLVNV